MLGLCCWYHVVVLRAVEPGVVCYPGRHGCCVQLAGTHSCMHVFLGTARWGTAVDCTAIADFPVSKTALRVAYRLNRLKSPAPTCCVCSSSGAIAGLVRHTATAPSVCYYHIACRAGRLYNHGQYCMAVPCALTSSTDAIRPLLAHTLGSWRGRSCLRPSEPTKKLRLIHRVGDLAP